MIFDAGDPLGGAYRSVYSFQFSSTLIAPHVEYSPHPFKDILLFIT